MMALVRKLLGIHVANTDELRRITQEQRQLARLARAERTDKLFENIIAEVRK